MHALLLCLVLAPPSFAQDPEPAPEAAAAPLPPEERARLRDLVDDTAEMTANERLAYLRALVKGGREPPEVQAGLERAIAATIADAAYAEALDAAIGAEPPVAIPVTEPDEVDESGMRVSRRPPDRVSPAPPRRDALPPPPGLPGLSPETLQAMREYRLRHLQVRTETTISGGSQTVRSSPYWGGPVMVTTDPIVTTRSWAVYQGPMRLDVPTYLELAGEEELRTELVGRIERKRWLSRTYYGVAAGGVLAIAAGFVGVGTAETSEDQYRWSTVGTVGLGATVVGLIGGSFPAASATRLRTDYGRTVDILSAQRTADGYNESLRQDLDLTPEEALRVEQESDQAVSRFQIR